jgi:hypothetical protein
MGLFIAVAIALGSGDAPAQMTPAASIPVGAPADSLFAFRSGMWYNLNHFLYQFARARKGVPDMSLPALAALGADTADLEAQSPADRLVWSQAVDYYVRERADRPIDFDSVLVETNYALAARGDSTLSPGAGLPDGLVEQLNRVAPLYRRVWWTRHDRGNRLLVARLDSLLTRYGDSVVHQLVRAYRVPWPERRTPVEVTAFANWGGAYTTGFPPLITIASQYAGHANTRGLEQLFHEESHLMMDSVHVGVQATGLSPRSDAARQLEHAIIFFTAGETVRAAAPDHVTFAEWRHFWPDGTGPLARYYAALDTIWRPYLKGKGQLTPTVVQFVRAVSNTGAGR